MEEKEVVEADGEAAGDDEEAAATTSKKDLALLKQYVQNVVLRELCVQTKFFPPCFQAWVCHGPLGLNFADLQIIVNKTQSASSSSSLSADDIGSPSTKKASNGAARVKAVQAFSESMKASVGELAGSVKVFAESLTAGITSFTTKLERDNKRKLLKDAIAILQEQLNMLASLPPSEVNPSRMNEIGAKLIDMSLEDAAKLD